MSEQSLQDKLRKADLLHNGPVKLRSESMSNVYADIKKAYGNPNMLSHMARVMLRKMDVRTNWLAASGHGGIPLATAMSLQSELPLALVRDKAKDHGLEDKLIDGYIPSKGGLVTLVDDVFTSGGSLLRTGVIIEATGAEILECHVVVTRADTSNFEYLVRNLFVLEDLQNP